MAPIKKNKPAVIVENFHHTPKCGMDLIIKILQEEHTHNFNENNHEPTIEGQSSDFDIDYNS